jgi:hypothetical protein
VAPATQGTASLSKLTFYFMTAVVAIQGGHVVEHIVQLVQVSLLRVPEQDALGLLGYVLQFNGTEEWLHLGYNTLYLLALYALIIPLWRITPAVIPRSAFIFFITASVWLETWHMVEHGVIISHVIANGGCPCPGIGDTALGLSDTILHFIYNAIAYAGLAYAYILILRDRRDRLRRPTALLDPVASTVAPPFVDNQQRTNDRVRLALRRVKQSAARWRVPRICCGRAWEREWSFGPLLLEARSALAGRSVPLPLPRVRISVICVSGNGSDLPATSSRCVLWQLELSHYNEKCAGRWTTSGSPTSAARCCRGSTP